MPKTPMPIDVSDDYWNETYNFEWKYKVDKCCYGSCMNVPDEYVIRTYSDGSSMRFSRCNKHTVSAIQWNDSSDLYLSKDEYLVMEVLKE